MNGYVKTSSAYDINPMFWCRSHICYDFCKAAKYYEQSDRYSINHHYYGKGSCTSEEFLDTPAKLFDDVLKSLYFNTYFDRQNTTFNKGYGFFAFVEKCYNNDEILHVLNAEKIRKSKNGNYLVSAEFYLKDINIGSELRNCDGVTKILMYPSAEHETKVEFSYLRTFENLADYLRLAFINNTKDSDDTDYLNF